MLTFKQITVVLLITLSVISLATASPIFFKKKHEHIIIHVPYKVHHHTHIEKVPIYKPVYITKHVPVYKEVHVPAPVHIEDHGWNSGWW